MDAHAVRVEEADGSESDAQAEAEDKHMCELRALEDEKRRLEYLVRDVERRIALKVSECKHDMVQMREDGPYGERYLLCRRCRRTF